MLLDRLHEQRGRPVIDPLQVRAAALAVLAPLDLAESDAVQQRLERARVVVPPVARRALGASAPPLIDAPQEGVWISGVVFRDGEIKVGDRDTEDASRLQHPVHLPQARLGDVGMEVLEDVGGERALKCPVGEPERP